jgi:hypothetical protein
MMKSVIYHSGFLIILLMSFVFSNGQAVSDPSTTAGYDQAKLSAILPSAVSPQSLTTDQADYQPGSVVTFTGSGFQSGEIIVLRITHDPTGGDDNTSAAHQPWNIFADASGNFVATWTVPLDQDERGAHLVANQYLLD